MPGKTRKEGERDVWQLFRFVLNVRLPSLSLNRTKAHEIPSMLSSVFA